MRFRTIDPVRFALVVGAVAALACSASAGGLTRADLDPSVKPTTDFYRYAVGGWLARNPIPADRTEWGSFDQLQQTNEVRLQAIVSAPDLSRAPSGSEARKIGDLYAACMDTTAIDAAGIAALQPELAAIGALASTSDLADAVATGSTYASQAPALAFGSEQDPKHATRVIAGLGQGGLSLPTRDYYLETDPHSVAIRAAYATYLTTTFGLLGDDRATAAAEAASVVSLETTLAKASKSPDALRDPFANYHPLAFADVVKLAPHFAWQRYFATVGLSRPETQTIDVGQPEFVTALDATLTSAPLATWKSYLRWHAITTGGTALPAPYRAARFAFRKALTGVAAEPPRARTCTNLTGDVLGFAVGSRYAAAYFPPAARERARAEIATIKGVLHDDIESVAWMGPQTRAAALAKLAKLSTLKVGYPDHPREYTGLAIDRANFLGDVLAGARFEFARDATKIGKPVDRGEWGLTPQTINAYYDPSMNEIVIPAGILQPPFFDAQADDALNFGGIGAVIGHEMTHGFDDEGSDFDGDGNLNKVVTEADAANFHARVQCVVSQLGAYKAADGLNLNGKLDAGEATADIGGTTLAYRALQRSLAGKAAPPIDGFTPVQRFYLNWAQVWHANVRPEAERAQIIGDPHPVSPYRVNGTLSDATPFYDAFAVQSSDPMYLAPEKRCQIW